MLRAASTGSASIRDTRYQIAEWPHSTEMRIAKPRVFLITAWLACLRCIHPPPWRWRWRGWGCMLRCSGLNHPSYSPQCSSCYWAMQRRECSVQTDLNFHDSRQFRGKCARHVKLSNFNWLPPPSTFLKWENGWGCIFGEIKRSKLHQLKTSVIRIFFSFDTTT